MSVKERLNELIISLKLRRYQFAESIGASSGNVSDWLSKDNKNPSIDALMRISSVHNVNINWLLTGTGSMFIPSITSIESIPSTDLISIPIYTDIAAGSAYPATYGEPLEILNVPAALLTHPGPYMAFKVNGQSMEPLIQHGDYVVLSQNWKGLSLSSRICAFRTPDGITLKTLVMDKKSKCTFLFPVNQAFNYTVYDKNDQELVMFAVLVLSIRKYI